MTDTRDQQTSHKPIWRLNKFIAHCGLCSRRKAEQLVRNGGVEINGRATINPFEEIDPDTDQVTYRGKLLKRAEKLFYILLNKPKDVISTLSDERNRRTVIDLLGSEITERVYPVGRLDRYTTGLILLTNDGKLTQKLSHPSFETPKVYEVVLDQDFSVEHLDQLRSGITLDDGFIRPDAVHYTHEDKRMRVTVRLHSGRNRIVRRMFAHLGYEVVHLDRTYYAGLTKKNLPRGRYRLLTEAEIRNLKHLL